MPNGWGPIYRFLGLRTAYVQEGMSWENRKSAYAADVTYVTAKEAGFDFLRDGLATNPEQRVHRPFYLALVDEADSILIDEARIPLVIAGTSTERSNQSNLLPALVRDLVSDRHYVVDPACNSAQLTDEGFMEAERHLKVDDLHATEHLEALTELNAALHAQTLMRLDVHYIIRNGQVEIVDEFTGRVVEDRHWPDGLQAAVEAKEGLRASKEGKGAGSNHDSAFSRTVSPSLRNDGNGSRRGRGVPGGLRA